MQQLLTSYTPVALANAELQRLQSDPIGATLHAQPLADDSGGEKGMTRSS